MKEEKGKSTSFSGSQSHRHWHRNLSRRPCETEDLRGITFDVISHDRKLFGRYYFRWNFTWPDRIKLLCRDFSECRQSGGGWGWGLGKNRYLQEHLISDLLSRPGKEVIGWNHKSVNRIQRVNRIRAKSTKGTALPPQHLKHIYYMVFSGYSL